MVKVSPIVIFSYLRLDKLKKTIQALLANVEADQSELIIFSDGAKYKSDLDKIEQIRTYLKTIKGFKSITIHESQKNIGLANSIIKGVSSVLKHYPSVIVLEDDLVPSTNFLSFMNQALEFYKNNQRVLAISGYSPVIKGLQSNEVYFTHRTSSWGWACWADRWDKVDWNCSTYSEFEQNNHQKAKFNQMGSDMTQMLKKQMEGELNSWAIRFCFHQFNQNLLCVHPAISKIINLGFNDENASNTISIENRFNSEFDTSSSTNFYFEENAMISNKYILKQFLKDNSVLSRILNKVNFFIHRF